MKLNRREAKPTLAGYVDRCGLCNSLADCVHPRSDCRSCAVRSLSRLSAKRSANHTQRPKSSNWNSPRPFYYSACISEVFTLQRPAKKLWAELGENHNTTVYRSTI